MKYLVNRNWAKNRTNPVLFSPSSCDGENNLCSASSDIINNLDNNFNNNGHSPVSVVQSEGSDTPTVSSSINMHKSGPFVKTSKPLDSTTGPSSGNIN